MCSVDTYSGTTQPAKDSSPCMWSPTSIVCMCTTYHSILAGGRKSKGGYEGGEGFPLEEGPFVKAFDSALKSFNVHREAYFGGTFVGNQVHRTPKVTQIHVHKGKKH